MFVELLVIFRKNNTKVSFDIIRQIAYITWVAVCFLIVPYCSLYGWICKMYFHKAKEHSIIRTVDFNISIHKFNIVFLHTLVAYSGSEGLTEVTMKVLSSGM
jgi:hypothetical protein